MVGFPKVIQTKADLVNTFKMVRKGKLKAEDWLAAVEKLENQNFIFCPILEKSEDRKAITIMFCNEVSEGDKVKAGNLSATVTSVEHIDIENQAAADQEDGQEPAQEAQEATGNNSNAKHTIITISRAVAVDLSVIGIPAEVTFYDRLGISKEEVEEMKGALA